MISLARDGAVVCVAQHGRYHIVDIKSKAKLELFEYDMQFTIPTVKHIGNNEVCFL